MITRFINGAVLICATTFTAGALASCSSAAHTASVSVGLPRTAVTAAPKVVKPSARAAEVNAIPGVMPVRAPDVVTYWGELAYAKHAPVTAQPSVSESAAVALYRRDSRFASAHVNDQPTAYLGSFTQINPVKDQYSVRNRLAWVFSFPNTTVNPGASRSSGVLRA